MVDVFDSSDSFLFPHKLQIRDSYEQWVTVCTCRDQPNNSGDKTSLADGIQYTFVSLVHIPKNEVVILPGQPVRVLGDKNEVRINADAKRFSSDDMQNRLWL